MKPNFNTCSDIKDLSFFTKEICSYYCRFLHTQKDSGGASIHRIDESFPLKLSLVFISILFLPKSLFSMQLNQVFIPTAGLGLIWETEVWLSFEIS